MALSPYCALSNSRAIAGDLAKIATSMLVLYAGFLTLTLAPYTLNPWTNWLALIVYYLAIWDRNAIQSVAYQLALLF